MGGEIVACASVAGGLRCDAGPVFAAEDDRMAGDTLVCGAAEAVGIAANRVDDTVKDLRADVREVDQGHDRGGGVGVQGGSQATAQRGAHAVRPVGRLDPAHRRSVEPALGEDLGGLFGVGSEDDDDRVAPAGGHRVDGLVQPGRAVRVANQGLGLTHPAALTRGQQDADRRRHGRWSGVEGILHEAWNHAVPRVVPSERVADSTTFEAGQPARPCHLRCGAEPATDPQVRTARHPSVR